MRKDETNTDPAAEALRSFKDSGGDFSLTPYQRRILTAEGIEGAASQQFWILKIGAEEPIDLARLKRAWAETIAAHDAFGIVVEGDRLRQWFAPASAAISESELPDEAAVEAWIGERARRGLALGGQLWDLGILVCGEAPPVSLLRAHRLVLDERSLELIASEVSERYAGAFEGAAPSFRSFLAAGAREEDDEGRRPDADKEALSDLPPEALLLGCARSGGRALLVQEHAILSDARRAVISGFFRRFADADYALAAATIAFLFRLSSQRELAIAAPIGARPRGFESAIGAFGDTALLRIELDEEDSFESLFAKVEAAYDRARDHPRADHEQGGPVSAVVRAERDWPARFCGALASFSLDDAAAWQSGRLAPSGLLEGMRLGYRAGEASSGLTFAFNGDLYPQPLRKRLVEYFLRLLAFVEEEPGRRILDAELVGEEERERLLAMGQGRRPQEAADLLLAFARRVEETPGKEAVEFGERALSYSELDRATNRLARRLQSCGVTRGSRVAVAMPRGFGEIVALIAVLKAGGAYVPLDPSHPADRVRLVLEDAEPQALIAPSDSTLREASPEGLLFFALDDPLVETASTSEAPLELDVAAGQLAYILFTSGSTGRPKGVEIPRSAFANFLQSMAAEPGLSAADRVVAITTTTFDIAGLELFLPLYVGATVVIVDRDTARDPERLRDKLERSELSLIQATPATWRLLLDSGWKGRPGLRILCGGEAMNLTLAKRLSDCGSELWNVYGPTETTVWSTLELVPKDVERIAIGHPIDHTSITIRDGAGKLVPEGAIGEICIGGRGLSLGYRGRPELTAERFPTDARSGERFYKTGDLGRYLPDGRLECLGRIDHQVKVRGFRIEPADIEAQLRVLPGVAEVLVMALPREEGDSQLAAYWVGEASEDALSARARAALPPYMLPSAYVHLDAFPLTTSGKIDRKRLPSPESSRAEERSGTAPRDDRESLVAAIWRDLLGLPFVPVDKDFFSLGGTSFRAAQLRARIQSALGVELPLKTLFEHPTVEAIASRLGAPIDEDAPIILPLVGLFDAVPWIGLMGIHLYEDMGRALAGSHSMVAIHVPARYVPGIDAFPTVEELAKKYVDAIRQAQPKGPYYLVGLCHGGVVAFEAASRLQAEGERVALVVLLDAELPGGRRVLPLARSLYALASLVRDPAETLSKVRRKLRTGPSSAPEVPERTIERKPVDIPFDGPEIEKDLARYEAVGRRIESEVLVFRAAQNRPAPGIAISPEMGWSGRARRIDCHAVQSTHLDIVREPHAAEVARIMSEARRRLEEGEARS